MRLVEGGGGGRLVEGGWWSEAGGVRLVEGGGGGRWWSEAGGGRLMWHGDEAGGSLLGFLQSQDKSEYSNRCLHQLVSHQDLIEPLQDTCTDKSV